MKNIYTILFVLLISAPGQAQIVKLNSEINIDTLRVWMDYSPEIEPELQAKLQESVVKGIDRFNLQHKGFLVVLDSTNSSTTMRMNMGAINYVTGKDNAIWTGVSLVMLAGHTYAISTWGFTLPIVLLPSTVSKVQIISPEGLVTNKPKLTRFFVNPFGFFRKKEKQNDKMIIKTEKVLFKFLKNLDKQDEKNNRL